MSYEDSIRETYDVSDCFCCGSRNLEFNFDKLGLPTKLNSVDCMDCGVRGPILDTPEQAIKAWNELYEMIEGHIL